jgi:hypothetical protein
LFIGRSSDEDTVVLAAARSDAAAPRSPVNRDHVRTLGQRDLWSWKRYGRCQEFVVSPPI